MNRFSLSLLAGVAVLSMASAASAADLLVRQQPSMPGFVDMGSSGAWDGAYIGGFEAPAQDVDINWTGSLRGRAGFDAGAFMPYLTAGLAFAGATASNGPTDSTQMHFGWTAGGGVEVAVADQISLDLQYRYTDYGTATYDHIPGTFEVDASYNTHTIKAGVNFHF